MLNSLHYQNLILSLYKPFLSNFTDQTPSPNELVDGATKHLDTLIRLYYLRHGFGAMDAFLIQPLTLVAFMCMKAIDKHLALSELEATRSTLFLTVKGIHDQGRNHYLAEILLRVIRRQMRPEDAVLLKGCIAELRDKRDDRQVQAVHSLWPVSVLSKSDDVESHTLTNLVEQYARLNIGDEVGEVADTPGVGSREPGDSYV